MTDDPPAGTPAHRVLHAAVGDFQVSTYQADVLARTIGASVFKPAFLPGRLLERVPTFRIPAITQNPFAGSALVCWDNGPVRPHGSTGNGPTPLENTPPREGKDPHSAPRSTPAARRQKAQFLLTATWSTSAAGRRARPTTRSRRARARGRGA